jgi:hypothetical protein
MVAFDISYVENYIIYNVSCNILFSLVNPLVRDPPSL